MKIGTILLILCLVLPLGAGCGGGGGDPLLDLVCTDEDGDGYALEGGLCGPVDCDDGDAGISPEASEGPFGDATCSDGRDNDCDESADTQDPDCAGAGECETDGDCDDGLWCNGAESCDQGTCTGGDDPCPDDGLFCNGTESCDEAADRCEGSGDPCPDDGFFCNGMESCDEAGDQCVHAGNPCGPDGNACTDDVCNETSDACEYPCAAATPGDACCADAACSGEPICDGSICLGDGDCDDGVFCNGAETCLDSACQAGIPPCGEDGQYCNGIESCDEGGDRCVSSGDPCDDDGVFCNGTESCDEGGDRCVSSGDPCDDDGVFCNGTESCDEGGDRCVSSGDPCADDGAFCNGTESCDENGDRCVSSGDPCAPDGNGCTDDVCNEIDELCEYPCTAGEESDPCCEDAACQDEPVCSGDTFPGGSFLFAITGMGQEPASCLIAQATLDFLVGLLSAVFSPVDLPAEGPDPFWVELPVPFLGSFNLLGSFEGNQIVFEPVEIDGVDLGAVPFAGTFGLNCSITGQAEGEITGLGNETLYGEVRVSQIVVGPGGGTGGCILVQPAPTCTLVMDLAGE